MMGNDKLDVDEHKSEGSLLTTLVAGLDWVGFWSLLESDRWDREPRPNHRLSGGMFELCVVEMDPLNESLTKHA